MRLSCMYTAIYNIKGVLNEYYITIRWIDHYHLLL
jgi:hypothetical protein